MTPCLLAIEQYKTLYNLKRNLNRLQWKHVLPDLREFCHVIQYFGAYCKVCENKIFICKVCLDLHCCNKLYC